MKLFNVIGETISEGSVCELYVTKTKEEAMDRFKEEFEDTFFHYIYAIEIEEVDGYKIYLI